MGDRCRRRRRRSDVSSEDEDNIWSGSEATASQGSEYESGRESDQTDEELSRLNETPATDKEDNGLPTPDVQSDAENEDPLKKLVDPVEKDKGENQVEEVEEVENKEKVEKKEDEEEELVNEEEDNEEEEQSEDDKEKSDEESPTHVPKRGMFYQHDDRNYVNPDDENNKRSRGPRVDNTGRVWGGKKEKKWVHDMFDEEEQRPKEDWEKEKPQRRKREGPPKKHRESEFKHHIPRDEGRGPAPNPYIQTESADVGVGHEPRSRDTRRQSREGRGRAKHRSNEDQVRVGENDVGKESYRRPNYNNEPGKPNQGPRDREERSQSERRKAEPRGKSPEPERPEREDLARSRGGRRGGYKPQKFDKRDMADCYTGTSPENPVEKEPASERGTSRRRGGTRNSTESELEKEREVKHRGRDRDSEQRPRESNRDFERDRERPSGGRRRGGGRERRPLRYRDYDSDEDDLYEDEPENTRRPARRGREHEDEIWKQLEQLRLDQLRLGLDVQRVATQSRYREEGTVVGKGRSRHTRTSPNQNSLIYKIAQEKAQEMAANQSNSSPTESDQEDRVAVAYQDPELPQTHLDRTPVASMPVSQPKFKSSTVQTEGEIVTVKPKRYSQRSKNVDPNALREKVRETMSMEDYSGQYPGVNHSGGGGGGGGSYHPDPNYANFNPYAQEFMLSEQDRQYDQQMQQMMLLQQMSRNYPPPPPGNTDYIQQALLHQQQIQQQQAAMMAGYMQQQQQQQQPPSRPHIPHEHIPHEQDIMTSNGIKRSNKAIPIVDPTTQIHMAPVIHEN